MTETAPTKHRGAIVAVVIITAVAALFRMVQLDDLAVDQFDEGAYAMSASAVARGDWPEGGYPKQHFLAPPMLFGTAGLIARTTGLPPERCLFLIVSVLGALTCVAAFVLVRPHLGATAAVAAAACVALSDYHVTYSRIGLTDVPFTFFFVVAVIAWSRARTNWGWGWWLLAGLCTGLAWNTKYHGWLSGVIAASALTFDLFAPPAGRTRLGIVLRFSFAVLVACLCYLPWALWVFEQPGGYAGLVKEHARFVTARPWWTGGVDLWLANARQQWCGQLYYDGWLSRFAPAVAAFVAAFMRRRVTVATWFFVLGLGALGCAATGALTLLPFALLGTCVVLRDRTRNAWPIAAMAACFTILTPMYHHYIRLALPFMLAVMCLAGVGLDAAVSALGSTRTWLRRVTPVVPWLLVGGALVLLPVERFEDEAWAVPATWSPKNGIPRVARDLAAVIPERVQVDVLGEPPLVHHLERLGVDAHHVDTLDALRGLAAGEERWIVVSYYGRKSVLAPAMRIKRLEFAHVATTFFAVGEVRRLNNMSAEEALRRRAEGHRGNPVDVYHVTVR